MKKLLLLSIMALVSLCGFAQTPTYDVKKSGNEFTFTLDGDWYTSCDDLNTAITNLLNEISGTAVTVTIKSPGKTIIPVNKALIQQLTTGTDPKDIEILDLGGVAVYEFVGNGQKGADGMITYVTNDESTFNPTSTGNDKIKKLIMPQFVPTAEQQYEIPAMLLEKMTGLEELILPLNTVKVLPAAFANMQSLEKFKLNNGLKYIGNSAFMANNSKVQQVALDVPSSVEYIGPGAFFFRCYEDIYFHSPQAPICPVGKTFVTNTETSGETAFLYDLCYYGNNGQTEKAGGHAEANYATSGFANRDNYYNSKYPFVFIHFPASSEMEEGEELDVSSYKDATRVYHKVYGNIYAPTTDPITVGIAGHDEEFMDKVWNRSWGYDPIGKETTKMQFDAISTMLVEGEFAQFVPEEYQGKGYVMTGYADTYRGLNYIWPSQSQYARAYLTVANGVNWDGVTKYRPELTEDQINWMVEDGLWIDFGGTNHWVTVGKDIVYDDAWANEYNASLPDAKHEGDVKDTWSADDVLAWNSDPEKNPGAVAAGQSAGEYTAEEAIEYNASLPTAIHEGGVKEKWTAEDAKVNNESLTGAWHENDPIHPTAEEIIEHNADFDGAVWVGLQQTPEITPEYYTRDEYVNSHEGYSWLSTEQYNGLVESAIANAKNSVAEYAKTTSDKGVYDYTFYTYEEYVAKTGYTWMDNATYNTNLNNAISSADAAIAGYLKRVPSKEVLYTEETAAAYNAEHNPNPWTESTVIGYITEEDALTHNATLPNAVKADDTKSTYTAEEALAHNSNPETNPGAVAENDSKGEYTAETAAAYNATLPNAKHEGDTKTTYSAQDAIDYNKTISGHREAGYSEPSLDNPELQEYLSMIAFQSTRRCVFAANDGRGGEEYPVEVKGGHWWTLVLPFDLTKAQIDKYFGNGEDPVHVCKFNRVDREETAKDGNSAYVKFYFTDDQYVGKSDGEVVLHAHVPYMIYPTISNEDAAKINIPLEDVYFVPGGVQPEIIAANQYQGYEGSDHKKYRYIGNYDTMLPIVRVDAGGNPELDEEGNKIIDITPVVVPQYNYMYAKKKTEDISKYKFYFNQKSNVAWSPNKCVIQVNDRSGNDDNIFFNSNASAKQISVFGDWCSEDDEATAIENIIIIAGNGEDSEVIYNLNGQQLQNVPEHGIYIKGGKKYMNR